MIHWQRLQTRLLTAIAVLVALLFVSLMPAFGKATLEEVIPTAQVEPPALKTPALIAARGCEGAGSAKTNLLSARDKLNAVRGESRNLRRALDNTRIALDEVDIHLKDKRC